MAAMVTSWISNPKTFCIFLFTKRDHSYYVSSQIDSGNKFQDIFKMCGRNLEFL